LAIVAASFPYKGKLSFFLHPYIFFDQDNTMRFCVSFAKNISCEVTKLRSFFAT